MRSTQKEVILATCCQQLKTIWEVLGINKDPIIYIGNVSQFLQGHCKRKDGEIAFLAKLEMGLDSLIDLIFVNELDMASMVGVGIHTGIVTLELDSKKVVVTKYDESFEQKKLWDTDDYGFQIVTLHLQAIQNKYNNDTDKLPYRLDFNNTSSGEGEEVDYKFRLYELAKLLLWRILQEQVLKKDVFDIENSIHKLIVSNPILTIWGLWEMVNKYFSVSSVRNDGSNPSSSGGSGNGRKLNGGEDGPNKDNHSGGEGGGGGGGGGGSTSDGSSDGEEDLIVEVHPGYDCLDNVEHAKHIQSITIDPTITVHFKKTSMRTHEIRTELFVHFGMGNAGPNEFGDHFAWYQDHLAISLQCASPSAARLKHEAVNIIGVEDVKSNHSKTITTSTTPNSTTMGGALTLRAPVAVTGTLNASKTFFQSAATSSQDCWTREFRGQQLPNGFIPKSTTNGGFQPDLSYTFSHGKVVPDEVLDNEECWKECACLSMCGSYNAKIEGRWEILDNTGFCPYNFNAERTLKGLFRKESVTKPKCFLGKKHKIKEKKLEKLPQKYVVTLCVNHAMTHIHKFHKFFRMEQGETCHGVLEIGLT